MKFLIVFAAVCIALSWAVPLDIVEDEEGQQYYIVPVSRVRRQTNWGLSNSGVGASHTGTIFDNNAHRIDGTVSAAKNFHSPGLRPDQVGGRVDYLHKPSSSTGFVSADNYRGYGTDVNAGVKYNIHQGRNWNADVTGQYGRHFGGPGGTGRPNAGAFLNVQGKF